MTDYYYNFFLAILLLGVGLLSYKRGFWEAVVKSVAALLATVIALRFVVPFSGVMEGFGAENFSQSAALILLFIGALVLLSVLAGNRKVTAFFPKNVQLLATLLLLGALGAGGWFAISNLSALRETNVPAPAPAPVEAAPNAPADGGENAQNGDAADAALGEAPGVTIPQFSEDFINTRLLTVWELLVLALLFVFWARTGSWIAYDAPLMGIKGTTVWNALSAFVFPIGLCAALFLRIPWLGLLIPAFAWLIPALSYVGVRNRGLAPQEKVMTPTHIRDVIVRILLRKKKQVREPGWAQPIELFGWGKELSKEERRNRTEALKAQSGSPLFCELVYTALKRKATALKILTDEGGVSTELFIDGFWHPMRDVFRRPLSGDEALRLTAAMKTIIGGNPEEMRERQVGQFSMEYDKKQGKSKKKAATLLIQGKGNGEEALIQIEYLHLRFGTLERLGMTQQRVEQVQRLLKSDKGLIVFSAPPGQGLRTLTNIALTVSDRFTRDFVAVEDIRKPYWTIENVQLNTYDSAKGETPMTVLPDVLFREPRVLVLRDVVNVEALSTLCREVKNDRLIFTTFRARDSAETIIRMLKTGVDPKLLADSLTAVISQRLVRILCPACKEEEPANPEVLRKLGISPNFVSCLYRKRTRPSAESGGKVEPCPDCFDIGFKKRMGLYDIITINDEMRQVIATNPTEEAIRRAAAKSGERGFITDGSRLVAWGATSFEELVRALK